MAKEMMKDMNNGIVKAKADVSVLREDLDTLKQDARVVLDDAKVLGRDLKVEGRKQLSAAEERAKEALEQAKEKGRDQFEILASFVQSNPGQSIAIAFVGGIIASLLLGGRR
jgi:ElaB/YqjD/DUF883 family membrane-anchored ribosome-binding protein